VRTPGSSSTIRIVGFIRWNRNSQFTSDNLRSEDRRPL
jgi:hypothetical protein